MRADITRSTYRPAKRFSGVRMQQGRVQLDADWNEQLDIQAHLDRTMTVDVVGPCGVPETGGGFQVAVSADGKDLDVSAGRIYVDGILCENFCEAAAVTAIDNQGITLANLLLDGVPLAEGQWLEVAVPVQGQAPNLTQVQVKSIDGNTGHITFVTAGNYQGVTDATARRIVTYLTQPDLPAPPHLVAGPPASIDLADGDYLAYLDVWHRGLTAHEDPSLLEQALGGPDTAYRSKTIWQVRLMQITSAQGPIACGVEFPDWDAFATRQPGALAARAKAPDQQSGDPLCLLPPGSKYNGLENQLYRVEIHTPGALGTATFKWSRENGSVEARWHSLSGSEIKVDSTGRDSVLGFNGAGSIELVDDSAELASSPNPIGLIKGYMVADDTTLVLPNTVNPVMPDLRLNPRVRRWENQHEVPTSAAWIPLERGVEVQFSDTGAFYNSGDYWLIPARTPSGTEAGDVDWPVDEIGTALLKPPDGIRHHYCRLALVHVKTKAFTIGAADDCRLTFPSLATLDAEDIAYTGACAGAGDTVESALEFLCANTDLPDHNLHLHGTGIVCGLQVQCVGSLDKKVEVKSGQAIAHDGTVVNVKDQQFDIISAAANYDQGHQGGPLIITDAQKGDGEAALFLAQNQQNAWTLAVEPFDPALDTPQSRLDGTLLKNIYDDCIKKLQTWLQQELNDPNNTSPASKADQLRAALTNLSYQVINASTGQNIFLSLREHKLLLDFYNGLKAQLQGDTYCAMFNNARPYPDYAADTLLQNLGMDTVFGKGAHTRLRLRPGTNDAYTVGGGLNPLQPSTTMNHYDLKAGQLVDIIDPLAGVTLQSGAKASGGTDSVRDVAFLGNFIFVIIPTRDGQNTIIRPGTMVGSRITWMTSTTICGVKLVTLATTSADKKNLYAIGEGSGIYKLDLSNIGQITAVRVGSQFDAVGHLRMDGKGRAYATGGDSKNGRYTGLYAMDLSGKAIGAFPTLVDPGVDDIAIDGVHVFVVTGEKSQTKMVMSFSMDTMLPAIDRAMPAFAGGAQLEYYKPTDQLMLAEQGDFSLRLMSASNPAPPTQKLLPMQVSPVAIATDDKSVYVLNYVSNTIINMTDAGTLVNPSYDTAPLLDHLAAYRAAALEAYADLAGGFAEYLKDCLCDHLMVDCPDPNADPRLYLGTVRIRANLVDRICNLNKRRYVKSFPTVGYWLSLFPVLPLFKWAIARFCCITIPDTMSKYQAGTGGSGSQPGQSGSNPIETLRQMLGTAQGVDLFSFLGNALSGGGVLGTLLQEAFLPSNGQSPQSSPQTATDQPPPRNVSGGRAITGQPTRNVVDNLKASGVNVEVAPYQASRQMIAPALTSYFTDPVPGSTVTLYDRGGTVQAYTLLPQGPAADLQTQVTGLSHSIQAKDEQLSRLQSQFSDLQLQHAQLLATQRQHLEMVNSLQALVSVQRSAPAVVAPADPASAPAPAAGPAAPGEAVTEPIAPAPALEAVQASPPTAAIPDAVQRLMAATLIKLDRLTYVQAGIGPITGGPRERATICVPKVAGQLGFTVDTVRDLGVEAQYSQQLVFEGEVSGMDPDGDPVITWTIEEPIDRDVQVLGVGVHIEIVRGSITAALRAIEPTEIGEDCQGTPRVFTVRLGGTGGTLSVPMRAFEVGQTIELTEITVTGKAGG